MTFQKSLAVLGGKGHHETIIGVWQVEALKVRLLLHPTNHHQRFSKISLRLSSSMRQRHEYLLVTQPRLTHVILHNRVTAPKSVLRLEPLPDAFGRMPLLFRLRLILYQDMVDDPQPGTQLRTLLRLLARIAGRQ